jgi:hypothetical protein
MKNLIRFVFTVAVVWVIVTLLNQHPTVLEPEIDPKLASFVDEWKSDMMEKNIDFRAGFNRIDKISIVDLNDELVGLSDKRSGSVMIDPIQFEKGNNSVRATVYHELGHYVFGLEHGDCLMMMETEMEEKDLRRGWSTIKESYLLICKEKEFESKY